MTNTDYETLNHDAALRFLQTAVVVDDAATVSAQGGAGGALITPGARARSRATERERAGKGTEPTRSAAPRVPVDVKALSDALADKGITCGVLKPTPDEAEHIVIQRVVQVSAQVDLVVLDWILDQTTELNSLGAVREIVAADRGGCRVIAIYTSQESLIDIADELDEQLEGVERADDDRLMLRIGGTRIALFRKAGADPAHDDGAPSYTETQLADQLIEVFLDLAQGWVRGVALNTMAAIRENVHAVLTRLDPSLDLGYAGHLLRLEHVDEGALQLLDAVGGELRGVVEDDERSHAIAGPKALDAWIRHLESIGRIATSRELLEGYLKCLPDDRAELRQSVIDDLKNHDLIPKAGFRKAQFESNATALFTGNFETDVARKADGDFAALLALRYAYARVTPALRLGTIVSDVKSEQYWLCMQPDCDSVRLNRPSVRFPLIPLRVVPTEQEEPINFVISRRDDNVHLFNPATPAAVDTYCFKPASDTQSVRFAFSTSRPDRLVVRTTGGKVFMWVAQLKPAHAARVAHGLGQAQTRIGLDESEWLRSQSR